MTTEPRKVNVLIVDDCTVVQLLLKHVLGADRDLRVVGTAGDGEAALAFLARQRPDVVLMDVHMPRMDGFEATRRIMETRPLPIVMCSATMQRDEVDTAFRALDAGAVAFVEKPTGPGHPEFGRMVAELVQCLKLMSEVAVVRRWSRAPGPSGPTPADSKVATPSAPIRLIAMGASTGGPPAIRTILVGLPRDLQVPVLIVQHIAAGFLDGMVDWLGRTTGRPTQMASHGQHARAGCVYLAPDDFQMGIRGDGKIMLSKDPPENGLRPAVSYLFRSVAAAYGGGAAGVLLSGMGSDGADALKMMRDKGALTIVQDEETSVVHGMPGEAVKLGAAAAVLPPERIVSLLAPLVRRE